MMIPLSPLKVLTMFLAVIVYVSATVTPLANVISVNPISMVQFQLDGVNLGDPLTTAPYSFKWDTTKTGDGPHTLTAIVTDSAGSVGMQAVQVQIVNHPKIFIEIQ